MQTPRDKHDQCKAVRERDREQVAIASARDHHRPGAKEDQRERAEKLGNATPDQWRHGNPPGAFVYAPGVGAPRPKRMTRDPHARKGRPRRFGSRLVVGCACLLAGCASNPGGDRADTPTPDHRSASGRFEVDPRPEQIEAFAGRTMVLPVDVRGRIPSDARVQAQLDDSRVLDASLWWIGLDPLPAGSEWLAPEGEWHATRASDEPLAGVTGFWAIIAPMPIDAVGLGVWIEGERHEVRWLPDPRSIAPTGAEWGAWERPASARLSGPLAERLLEPERRSPVRRWRAALASRGLEPRDDDWQPTTPASPGAWLGVPGVGPSESGVLDAFAAQRAGKWQVALARLWEDDQTLQRDLVAALTRTVDFGAGAVAPAWREDAIALDALLAGLLAEDGTAESRERAAHAFMRGMASGTAWVIDDAGAADAEQLPIGVAGIANLSAEEQLMWVRLGGDREPPELAAIGPWAAQRVELPPRDPRLETTVVTGVGEWRGDALLAPSPPVVRPPGARLGPLLNDWSMRAWLNSDPDAGALPVGRETGAMLYRDRGLWTLYVECFRDNTQPNQTATEADPASEGVPLTEAPAQEAVRVWVGPFRRAQALIRLSESGDLRDEKLALDDLLPDTVPVSVRDDRWAVHIPIPAEAIGEDGLLRIGLERIHADGSRTAWPRRMMPWQTEPGRLVLDLGGWD